MAFEEKVDPVDNALINALKEKEDSAGQFGKIVADFLRKFGPKKQLSLQLEFNQLMLKHLPDDE